MEYQPGDFQHKGKILDVHPAVLRDDLKERDEGMR